MGFFAEFSAWLGRILNAYIGTTTAQVAGALEPAFLTLGTVYVMIWGYLQLTGQIQEPMIAGLKRILMLALILGMGLRLWLFNSFLVDTVYRAPGQLAAAVLGTNDSVTMVDQIIFEGGDAANLLLQKAGFFSGDWSYYVAGFLVYLAVGVTAVYTIFLLSLARVALAVLLAIGPLFIGLLLFESTKRFFEAWLAQLANYALITILTGLVAALMLTLLSTVAHQAAAAGDGIQVAQAVRLCMAAGLIFLVMRQVMPMAAGLASGIALSSYGMVSRSLLWAFGSTSRHTRDFMRGAVMDRDTTRWDSLSRKAGFAASRAVSGTVGAMTARWRGNSIQRTP
jgi:type IV secretion system protein VirB6